MQTSELEMTNFPDPAFPIDDAVTPALNSHLPSFARAEYKYADIELTPIKNEQTADAAVFLYGARVQRSGIIIDACLSEDDRNTDSFYIRSADRLYLISGIPQQRSLEVFDALLSWASCPLPGLSDLAAIKASLPASSWKICTAEETQKQSHLWSHVTTQEVDEDQIGYSLMALKLEQRDNPIQSISAEDWVKDTFGSTVSEDLLISLAGPHSYEQQIYEQLGDAVLSWGLSRLIYFKGDGDFTVRDHPSPELIQYFKTNGALTSIAENSGIYACADLSSSESVPSNTMEAVIGMVYQTISPETAIAAIARLYRPRLDTLTLEDLFRDGNTPSTSTMHEVTSGNQAINDLPHLNSIAAVAEDVFSRRCNTEYGVAFRTAFRDISPTGLHALNDLGRHLVQLLMMEEILKHAHPDDIHFVHQMKMKTHNNDRLHRRFVKLAVPTFVNARLNTGISSPLYFLAGALNINCGLVHSRNLLLPSLIRPIIDEAMEEPAFGTPYSKRGI